MIIDKSKDINTINQISLSYNKTPIGPLVEILYYIK